jgi:TatD DNase family protein
VLTLERILLETDAPFMAPDKAWLPAATGLGGRKNEPAAMPAVCRSVAAALGVEAAVLARASTANAERFFGLAKRREAVYRQCK